MTIFQVLTYIIGIWRSAIEDGKNELPIVIPIVIYHGEDKWNYKTDLRDLILDYNNLPQCIKERMPVLKHDFININEHTEDDIEKYNPLAKMVIRSFKYIFADDDKLIKAFIISVDEASVSMKTEELSKMIEILLIYYGAANRNLTEENIISKIKELEGKGEKIMTILEARELKGIEKGIREGKREKEIEIAKVSKKIGLSIDVIADITGLTIEEVQGLVVTEES